MPTHAIARRSVPHIAAGHPAWPRLLAGLAGTMVVALAARVAIPLPFTPIPFTLQPLAVLALGLFLGPVDGSLAMLAYLAEGAAGLPVFSPTGPGGLLQLFGPTGGFLLAYPAVAGLCGGLVRPLSSRVGPYLGAAAACAVAVVVLFAAGAAWLEHLYLFSLDKLWTAAIAPFLPGEAAKILIAAGIYRSFHIRPDTLTH